MAAREVSFNPAFVFSPPWHLKQRSASSGRTSFSKKSAAEEGEPA
jgi:hypothetical protein